MTAFIIVSMIFFILSMISNIGYIISPSTIWKGGAVIGLICFSAMTAWSAFLLFN